MAAISRSLAVLFLTAVSPGTIVIAHTPVDFLEVLSVRPARPIEHAVELKSRFDEQRVETMLQGPQMFSRAVGCMNRPVKKNLAYLSWFKISKPTPEPIRKVSVLDMVRGHESKLLSINSAEFLLSPSQLIAAGSPDPIPEGLDQYKAYRVVDAPPIDREITLAGSFGPESRRLGKPVFVCLAVEEWHHDEFFPASHPNDCFVVYEMDGQDHDQKVSTIDQFGLNELQISRSRWLCVRGALLRVNEE